MHDAVLLQVNGPVAHLVLNRPAHEFNFLRERGEKGSCAAFAGRGAHFSAEREPGGPHD